MSRGSTGELGEGPLDYPHPSTATSVAPRSLRLRRESAHGRRAALDSRLNVDERTVDGFGREWSTFTYEGHDPAELDRLFAHYVSLFPWGELPARAVGFDAGGGSGRWATRVASRVERLHCVDASLEALTVARHALAKQTNCEFHHASIESM